MPHLVSKYNDFGYRELFLPQTHLLVITAMLLCTRVLECLNVDIMNHVRVNVKSDAQEVN